MIKCSLQSILWKNKPKIKIQTDSEALQSDFLLLEWSDKWLLKFNIDVYKIMHVRKKNMKND
jgi:hypothetical protein